jgi:hypothetical protein
MRWGALILVVAAIAVAATSAGAVPPQTCAKVRVSGHSYLVVVHGVSCKSGRTWVMRRLAKGHRVAPGFHCRKASAGSNVKVQCLGRTRPKGDTAYRYYYGIKQ